jgi:hypothetical protein
VIQNDEELKQNRLKLKNNLIALIACAISLFTLLVGVGSLIVSSPGPSWIGHPMIWVSLNIIIGLVCIPIWYRYGFKKV